MRRSWRRHIALFDFRHSGSSNGNGLVAPQPGQKMTDARDGRTLCSDVLPLARFLRIYVRTPKLEILVATSRQMATEALGFATEGGIGLQMSWDITIALNPEVVDSGDAGHERDEL